LKETFFLLFMLIATLSGLKAEDGLLPPAFNIRHDAYARFGHFKPAQLNSIGTVYHIVQDRTGFIWFGGVKGLGRFDGFQFRVYNRSNLPGGLPDVEVNALLMSPDGLLYIGTRAGVSRYNPATNDFSCVFGTQSLAKDQKPNDSLYVRAMHFSNDSLMWIETLNGSLGRLNVNSGNYRVVARHRPVAQPYYYYHSLVELPSGDIYSGGRGIGPYHFAAADSSMRELPVKQPETPGFKREYDVALIFPHSENQLWIGGLEGLYLYDIQTDIFTKYWSGTVYNMMRDKQGFLWLGTGKGACRIDPASGEVSYYKINNNDPQSLGGEKIFNIYQDRSGLVWFTHENGVSVMHQLPRGVQYFFHIPGMDNSPASSRITSLAHAGGNRVWAGTRDEGLTQFDYSTLDFKNYNPTNQTGIISKNIRSLVTHPVSGDLFIGYWSGRGFGHYQVSENVFRNYRYRQQDLTMDWYNDLAFRDHQTLYLGFWGGPGLLEFDIQKGEFGRDFLKCFQYQHQARLTTALHRAQDNKLWVGTTEAGILSYNPFSDSCMSYQLDLASGSGLSHKIVYDIVSDEQGRIWSAGKGLFQLDDQQRVFRQLPLKDPFSGIEIFEMFSDGEQTIWLLTERGVLRYHIESGWITDYSMMIGLRFKPDLAAIIQLDDKQLIIGGENGLALINPDNLGLEHSFPRIFLTEFEALNQVSVYNLSDYERIKIPYSKNFFTLHFGTDRFESNEMYNYYFKLEGFDTDWKPLSFSQGSVNFTNVPPGEYIFRIRAGDTYGNMGSEESKLVIIVLTPWYWEWWFLGGMLLLGILGILFIWRRRLHELNLSYQNIELNQKLLRLQMNPHFIFNSLTAIQNYIYSHKTKLAGEFLSDFARLIRLILDNSRHEFIMLDKEIETLRLYMQLQALRFDNSFDFSIEVDPEINPEITYVPPMLAQPFLENAIEHGISKSKRRGIVTIRYVQLEKTIRFEIVDNGVGLTASSEKKSGEHIPHESLSINICKERLLLLHKRNRTRINFSIREIEKSGKIEGTQVIFDIPTIEKN
jgi:ligand-binding sensor domain-containing protein